MRYIIFFLIALVSFNVSGQTLDKKRLKVGVVLSGGGAKGLAHVGVLKVIDSLGIQVDYVAGTSMGAIVGSLYASGYSGKELDSLFRRVDFQDVISDHIPRSSKTIGERTNEERYALSLPFNNFKLNLPSGLSRGQNTYNLLSRLTLHVSDVKNFKDLPIPFFCMATNIETGQPVMLEQGNLPQAVMASAALPSLFRPVVIDNQTLIDGGVVNNYPIDELRQKGIDVVIGVDVQGGLSKAGKLHSALGVLLQISNFGVMKGMKLKAEETDIYIKPDISGYSLISFDKADSIIAKGMHAAEKKVRILKTLKQRQQPTARPVVKKWNKDSITISHISLQGNKSYTRAYILGKLKLKETSSVSLKSFELGVNALLATNNFDYFYYKFEKDPKAKGYNFIAKIQESDINTYLKLGVHYDELYKSALLLNLTKKRILFDNDKASLDIILGDNIRYNFNYLIDKGFYWSIGAKSHYTTFKKGVSLNLLVNPDDFESIELKEIDAKLKNFTNQLYLKTLFRKDFVFSLGAEHKYIGIKTETLSERKNSDKGTVFENTDYFSLFSSLKLDTYDDKYFPSQGVFFEGNWHTYLAASKFNADFEPFSLARATLGYAFPVSNKISFNTVMSGGFKLGDMETTSLDFILGGYGYEPINNFMPFLGYDYISLVGNSFVKAYLGVDYEIFKKHHLLLMGNWANIESEIFKTGTWLTLPDYSGYGVGYALDSIIGPIQINYSFSPEHKRDHWFFNVGFWF